MTTAHEGTWAIVEGDERLSAVRARCVEGVAVVDTSLVSIGLENGDFVSFWPVFTPGGAFAYIVIRRSGDPGGTFVSITNDKQRCRACDRPVKGLSMDVVTKALLVQH